MMVLIKAWRRLSLWPRLVVAVTLGFLVLFAVLSLISLRAVSDSTNRILAERLVIAQMSAREVDRVFDRAFYELEKATEFAAFDPSASSLTAEHHLLAHAYGRVGTISLGVYFLDAQGRVVLSEPPERLEKATDLSTEAHIRQVMESKVRSVSDPFTDPVTGKPAVMLTVPIQNPDGTLRAILVGLVDLSGTDIVAPLRHARDLGHTGHAELVDGRGLIVASTDYGGFLQPGEHPDFYLRMLRTRASAVENTLYTPWHPVAKERADERHVMAFAHLSAAPWGVAVGGFDWETFAPIRRLRNNLLFGGGVALAFLWVVTLWGARSLVRPVRVLTGAATRMASGDLRQPVHLNEGGEIGALGQSLEAMRAQLKDSLEQVQRWGEELEVKVETRTAALTLSNRRLAALTAVASAANEARDLNAMLQRLLQVVLEHTGMEAGAIRLLDHKANLLTLAACGGGYGSFPCRDSVVSLGECPCGLVASSGTPLYLDQKSRLGFQPPCRAPEAVTLTALPLRSPKGILGVLHLSRRHGDTLEKAERQTLEAICDHIAVAVENLRLLDELRQMEAQQEVERLKAEFFASVSHELRTPLGFIKGYATTLLREDINIDHATQLLFLQIIDKETDNLQGMLDDLLDASRLHAGRLPIEKRSVALGALVQEAVDRFRDTAVRADHTLTVRLPQTDFNVMADTARVVQVLHNLLDNAVRYSEPGSAIDVTIAQDDEFGLVSVVDRGDGIPESELERIFEPFYRGESARRRSIRGTGLGLAICRGIIRAHGGRMWAESSRGAGSTFLFTLPTHNDGPKGYGPENS